MVIKNNKPTVYLETTIPSFYYSVREEAGMQVVRAWTRSWWDGRRHQYDLVTSVAVTDELEKGVHPHRTEKLALLKEVRFLPIVPEVSPIVAVYLKHQLMPRELAGDALHLALASLHRCNYLLTWNCRHLANANKFGQIRKLNERLHLPTPDLVTPLELGVDP